MDTSSWWCDPKSPTGTEARFQVADVLLGLAGVLRSFSASSVPLDVAIGEQVNISKP